MKPLPDILEIKPLTKPPNCTITVPGSKSITNRALILAALADGKCALRGALWADDTQVMVDSLKKLGFEVTVEQDPAEECNRTISVVGRGGEIPAKKAELYVGNAGTAARFLTALVCLGHGEYMVRGDERMNERPMKDLFEALRQLGAEILSPNDRLPATVFSKGLHGQEIVTGPPDGPPIEWGAIESQLRQAPKIKFDLRIDASNSTQFASALLLISRRVQGSLSIDLANQNQDGPYGYFAMTRKLCEEFRPHPWDPVYTIEPDLSSGSYFLAAEYIASGKFEYKVQISGWPQHPHSYVGLQIDSQFPRLLEEAPPKVSRILDLGDSILTLAVCALFWEHPLRVVDAARLRLQETNRIEAMVTELRKVGGDECAEETDDGFVVRPANPTKLYDEKKADIETYNDHRMAMCFAVLGLKVPGIRIKNPGCVSKTFPNFFEKLEQLRQ